MTYAFLTDTDIHTFIREEFKNGLTSSVSGQPASAFILLSEQTAIIQIKNKLRDRYKVEEIFSIPDPWDESAEYQVGALVTKGDKFFAAILENTGVDPDPAPPEEPDPEEPPAEPEEPVDPSWEISDPRNSFIVMITSDIMLYHLHARLSPRAVSDFRVKRYEDALSWLDQVKDGLENPDLPLLDDEDDPELNFGFDQQTRDHYY
ncbi:MAG TPA: DUF1320 family protein [Bacteroidales bacterium]|nr:DUF1320 family protein [Bacteroidales bacterium]HSA43584.1 DUF1320 family protein [Bacteroidales bacterium]